MSAKRPVVLSFSGHDPSGGAGIQADIETLSSLRCHAASVITALTEQNSSNVIKLLPQQATDIISQANTVLADFKVACIKIGLIGDLDIAKALHSLLKQHPYIPVVLDPVLAAGGGQALAHNDLIQAILELLLPCTLILTPNSPEARKLAGQNDLNNAGLALLKRGCQYVLITGTHEQHTAAVHNQLFHAERQLETYTWPRLPHSYHGSGCTLASAIAGLLSHGLSPTQAVKEAQAYTWQALNAGYQPGQGQHLPNRLFWRPEQTL
ncbi:MAG: hydroxymethylpyrimidine/phosphomethylpyrimidine kinase [Methylococcaceae bacterium]|jgi:hydroxymethylpyrimidine/phosphomethylpyrimidine kinase